MKYIHIQISRFRKISGNLVNIFCIHIRSPVVHKYLSIYSGLQKLDMDKTEILKLKLVFKGE